MNKHAKHWSGGAHVVRRGRVTEYLPGWPCCCSGALAGRLSAMGRCTRVRAEVTCKKCIAVLETGRLAGDAQ